MGVAEPPQQSGRRRNDNEEDGSGEQGAAQRAPLIVAGEEQRVWSTPATVQGCRSDLSLAEMASATESFALLSLGALVDPPPSGPPLLSVPMLKVDHVFG